MVNIGENILELSEINFMNFDPYVFDVDHVAEIRSELSITVLEKKFHIFNIYLPEESSFCFFVFSDSSDSSSSSSSSSEVGMPTSALDFRLTSFLGRLRKSFILSFSFSINQRVIRGEKESMHFH